MKQRILSAVVGIVLLIIVMFFYDTLFLNLAIAGVTLIACFELLVATKYINNKLLTVVCMVFSAAVPFFRTPYFNIAGKTACFLFVVVLFSVMLIRYKTIRLEQIGMIFLVATIIPFAFSTIIYLRDYSPQDGLFYIILTFLGAWSADIGAFFVGSFFGKHKLAPEISPKKTIEGSIGGLAADIISMMVFGFIYQQYRASQGVSIEVSYIMLGVLGFVCAIAAMFGDLSASIIKRSCNIKDFGHIMPGHGGVLDRFDSVLFVAPLVYIVVESGVQLIIR